VADGPERTAEEREAARLERERRRAGLFNDPEEHLPPVGRRAPAEPPPTSEYDVLADQDADDELSTDDRFEEEPFGDERSDDGPADDDRVEDERSDDERPAGTRRVSRLDAAPSGRRPRPAARPPRREVRRRPAPARGPRGGSWLGRTLAAVMVALAAVLIWFAVEVFQPFGSSPHGRVTVTIPAHSGASAIGDLLAREGVISSSFFFEVRAALSGDRSKLRSGTYQLQQGMSYSAVLTKLTTPPPAVPTTTLTISEGHTRQYVSALLRRQGIKGSYLAATRRSPLLDPAAYGAPAHLSSLEGFLFPDTFQLVKPVKMSALVADQLRDFKQRFAGVDLSYARSKHLTGYDVLKIASLVEAEAASSHDRPLVASVIYNRLRDGMMLQFDSTTRYATGNFTGPLTVSELQSPSPFNTHTHLGLPPTPIDSPSLASIQAAAHPAHTDYLYFFTKPCNAGGSVFTSTYTEFLHLLAVDRRNHC
jgi:peptidoglycan lytic transglycosylase G